MRSLTLALIAALTLLPDARSEGAPPPQVDPLEAAWETELSLYIDEQGPVYLARAFELVEGPASWSLSGMIFPLRAEGREAPVGFVYVGRGEVSLEFPAPEDALGFANRMVMSMGADREEMAPIAHGEAPFQTEVRSGVVFTLDEALLERVQSLKELEYQKNTETADGTMVVTAAISPPFGRAKSLLAQRASALKGTDRDPIQMLQEDLLLRDQVHITGEGSRLLADFSTEVELAGALGRSRRAGSKWLTAIRDPRGFDDPRASVVVRSYGLDDEGYTVGAYLSSELFPPSDPSDPLSPPLPPNRLDVERSYSQVQTSYVKKELTLEVELTTQLELRALGGPLQHLYVRVPRVESTPKTWEILGATVGDGREVAALQIEKRQLEDRRQTRARAEGGADPDELVLLVLPEPLEDGESESVVIRWRDTWAAAQTEFTDQGAFNFGQSTGLRQVAPTPLPKIGAVGLGEWKLAVGMELGSGLMSVQSGHQLREWHGDGWRWQESEASAPASTPALAIGRWRRTADEPVQGLPGVAVHMFERDQARMDMFAPEIRRIILFYQNFLPDFPYEEVQLFQAPDEKVALAKYDDDVPGVKFDGGFRGGVQGLISINRYKGAYQDEEDLPANAQENLVSTDLTKLERFLPKLAVSRLAYQVAHQYWGQWTQIANERDLWIAQSLSETYAEMYIRAAHGREDYDLRQSTSKKAWERWLVDTYAPLTRAHETDLADAIYWYYGPYVMMEMLRRRIGADYFATLDKLVAARGGDWITTEHLQAAFEEQTGRDLEDFFNFWIHGGYVPNLTLEYHLEPADLPDGAEGEEAWRIVGEVTSDVPFGTFDVPVRVYEAKRAERIWVTVRDGVGAVESEVLVSPPRRVKADLDPAGYVLARSRQVRRRAD